MRVACNSTPTGRVYCFYRTDRDVAAALKPIVPILLASHVDIIVGRVGDDPALMMRVGPVSGQVEATLLSLFEQHMSLDFAPVPT